MSITLSNQVAERIIEILSDVHDESRDDNPEFAAEIDRLCGSLQPQPAKLHTIVFRDDDGYYFEFHARTESEKTLLVLLDQHPVYGTMFGEQIIVSQHEPDSLPRVNSHDPALVGEYLFYKDPADDVSSGLYKVVGAPVVADVEDEAESYADSVIQLANECGTELEAFPGELSRTPWEIVE